MQQLENLQLHIWLAFPAAPCPHFLLPLLSVLVSVILFVWQVPEIDSDLLNKMRIY